MQKARTAHEPAKETNLTRVLASGRVKPRYTVLDAFHAARRHFLAGTRIDMQTLADELEISRVTLYRWVGSRDQLIAELLWACTEHHFTTYRHAHRGKKRTAAAALSEFVRLVNEHPGMRQLLDEEPDFALALLTSSSSTYQKRYLALVRALIEEDRLAGFGSSEIPIDDLAYCAARVTQSYIHTRAITGDEPDAHRAAVVLNVLLR